MKRHLTEEELIQHKFKLTSDDQAAAHAEHLSGCAECRQRLERLDQKFAALDLLREDVSASDELISQAIAQAKQPVRRKTIPFGKYHWLGTAAAVLVLGLTVFIGDFGRQETERTRSVDSTESERYTYHDRSSSRPELEKEDRPRLLSKGLGDKDGSRVQLDDTATGRELATSSPPAPSTKSVERRTEDFTVDPTTRPDADISPRSYAFAPHGPGSAPEKKDATAGQRTSGLSTPELTDITTVARTETLEDVAALPGTVAGESVLAKISEKPPFAPASAIELVTLPRRDSVQLTIYNSADLTLVREKRNLTLKMGWNWLQLMWANTLIDPTSLSLEPAAQGGKIDVQQLVFPARLRELGRWLIRSEISGQVPFEITYFTSGLTWRAFYMGTLSQDEKKMRLQGYVRVANGSGEDYENAQTRLLVGKVNVLDKIADLAKRQYAYDRPGETPRSGGRSSQWSTHSVNGNFWFDSRRSVSEFDGLDLKEIKKEGLSEYFLYTIEGTETIPDKWGKRLPSFDIEDIDVESLYKYDEERWGSHTIRFVSFANDDEHNLGETPIPDGSVKIYGNAGEQGYLSYVGGTNIKYIPVGEEVELNLGAARLVEVEPKLMSFETENYVFDNKGNVAGWDELRTWQMEITNTRPLPVEIEITRGFGTPYWTLQTDALHDKHDATHARFETQLQQRSKKKLEYTVTTYHGRRQEQINE